LIEEKRSYYPAKAVQTLLRKSRMKNYALILGLFILIGGAGQAQGQTLPKMRISVENTDLHVQAKAVRLFADALRRKLATELDIEFFSNARLFRDQDVVQALRQGKVEMAVPGTWNVSRFEPNVEIFLLPVFYGQPAEANYRVAEGKVGEAIARRLENKLDLKMLGRWMDLGHAHLFGVNQKIVHHEDIEGLRVRIAGGVANAMRIQGLGGRPQIIPWPDLPEYLLKGRVDAVLTSYETVLSGRLQEKGVRYAFEDRQYFPQYIPLVRMSFWRKLSSRLQRTLTETWEELLDSARKEAGEAQLRAKEALARDGLEVVVPDPQRMEFWRKRLLAGQGEMVKAMGIDPELVERIPLDLHGKTL
jgi:C4-dicarboxylate-binding protein DctP